MAKKQWKNYQVDKILKSARLPYTLSRVWAHHGLDILQLIVYCIAFN